MFTSKLAIVIPAYKGKYFKECLQSIANQTNKAFTVYIGDDASNDDLERIATSFKNSFHLVYKRFEENLGKDSLASHWNRCLSMIENEKWIWLFPDDDIMQPHCVERFLDTAIENNHYPVYRFDLEIINNDGKVIRATNYPAEQSGEDFFLSRLKLQADSVISNYIFNTATLLEKGFVAFSLAWCSDDATVIRETETGKILLISGAKVLFRLSGENISSVDIPEFAGIKVEAKVDFLKWVFHNQKFLSLQYKSTKLLVLNWIVAPVLGNYNDLSRSRRRELIREIENIISMNVAFFTLKKKCHYLALKIANFFHP